MSTAFELVQDLRARGITLRADGDTLCYRPASALSAEDVDRLRAAKAEVLALLGAPPEPRADLVALTVEYRGLMERLWDLAAHAAVDRAEFLRLENEKARLCDDLGPLWAARCARPWFLAYAHQHGRCPECGDTGRYHDPDTGAAVPLEAPATPEAGPTASGT